jgi:membrane associated rhomboid family serine protease
MYLGEGLVVLMAWTLSLIYSGFETRIAGLVLIGIGLTGWGLHREVNQARTRARLQASLPEVTLGLGIVLVLLWFLIALFPPDFASGEVTTNIFAHAAGFAWGAFLPLVLWKRR